MTTEISKPGNGLWGLLTKPLHLRFPSLFTPLWTESPFEVRRRDSRLMFLAPIGALMGLIGGLMGATGPGVPAIVFVPVATLAGVAVMYLAAHIETFLRIQGGADLGNRALLAEISIDMFGGGVVATMVATLAGGDIAAGAAVGASMVGIFGWMRRIFWGSWIDDTIRLLAGDGRPADGPDYSTEHGLIGEGRFSDAVESFRAKSRERQGHAGPLVEAARLMRDRGQYESAMDLFVEALNDPTLDGRRASAFARQIWELADGPLSQPDLAIPHLESVVERFDETPEVEWIWKELTIGMSSDALVDDFGASSSRVPAVRAVEKILSEAFVASASDIHLEDYPEGLRVRYRIDGMLQDAEAPPSRIRAAVLARVRVMGGLNPSEHPTPRDARIRVPFAGRDVDIRMSTVPTLHGESIALRILDTEGGLLTLTDLGLPRQDIESLMRIARRPNGMILTTGPGGSGKSTTLHAVIRELSTGREKIFTVEDPVEYTLEGVCQVSVNPRAGMTFASSLRSLVRQDPDVLLIGEIRDQETAEIAMHASLTGHLVLSTLHTTDATSSLHRLVEMGVEDYMVVHTLEASIAQRLVRRVCAHCAEETELDAHTIAAFGNIEDTPTRAMVGAGCDRCRNTGYSGRIGLFEMLWMNQDMRNGFLDRVSREELREIATANGTRTLRSDGIDKIRQGITTPLEVLRVTTA
jgi:type II secretory ATPase GspE/PulE/Tfp pilus assembly ATPase PilB-like protein